MKRFEEMILIGMVILPLGLFGMIDLDGNCFLLNSCKDGISNTNHLWNSPVAVGALADDSSENFDTENETIFEFQPGVLKFDPELNELSCDDIIPNPKIKTGRSLNIDDMEGYFFIILGKTDFGEYHYLQIEIPEKDGKKQTESYILNFKKQDEVVRSGLYQNYDRLAVYVETDKESKEFDYNNYKRFLTGQSKDISPSSQSLGPGDYDMHAILFQSDQENWISDEVCAISLHWPVSVDSIGYINPENPNAIVGRIYEIEKKIDDKIRDMDISNDVIVTDSESQIEQNPGTSEIIPNYYLGELKWTESSSSPDGYGVIKVYDPDMNLNSTRVDYFPIKVWSETDMRGLEVAMVESEVDSGEFYGDLDFSQKYSMSHTLRVSSKDVVTALYEDYTVPAEKHQDKIDLTDILEIIPKYVPPFEQLEQGALIDEITCVEGKELFIKNNSKPLCLKQKTFEILTQRGYF